MPLPRPGPAAADLPRRSAHRVAGRTPPAWPPRPAPAEEQLSLRQLRHQTANTWQRILCDLWTLADDATAPEARALAEALERRIQSTMAISDALFGLTQNPGRMRDRLERLGRHVLRALAAPGQEITLEVVAEGEESSPALHLAALRVAQEMLANAIRHGLHARLRGHLRVELCGISGGLRLRVRDDGWGPPEPERIAGQRGEGMALMHDLAALHQGRVWLTREEGWTVAGLDLPPP